MKLDSEITVSVIVLTYNHVKYIKKAIDSILSQKTTFQYEILIADDASSDGTSEIVKAYQDQCPDIVRAFVRPKNLGASRNAFEAMRSARGKYLASCEGDDYWLDEQKLQLQVDFLEANPGFSGCVHKIRVVDENDQICARQEIAWAAEKEVFSLSDFKGINLPGHGVSMLRRNYFLDDSFDGTIIYKAHKNIADRTNALLWLSRGDFYCIDRVMACYRSASRGANLTNKLFANNTNYILMDLQYTKKLNEYAAKVLNIDAGFVYHIIDLLVACCLNILRNPSAENLYTFKAVFTAVDKNPKYFIFFIKNIWKKIKKKVFNIK